MLNDMLVSEIKGKNGQIIISDDQIEKINRSTGEFDVLCVDKEKVELVKIEQATEIAHAGDYRRFYPRSRSVVSYGLRDAFFTPDQIYNFWWEEDGALKVASGHGYKAVMEVMVMRLNQSLSERIEEKDATIRDLTSKVKEFERKLNFVPSGLVLPDGYFDDLVE